MPDLKLPIKVFADGADLASIRKLAGNPLVKGFTTNPTLMRGAGVTDYAGFARQMLEVVTELPVSFEVFADDFPAMEAQAREIASWARNVNVKIPITNTKGELAAPLVKRLSADGIAVNVTAMMTLEQVKLIADALDPKTPAIVSVFAGRIADTGRDPVPHMREAGKILSHLKAAELLWASPRELLNVYHAVEAGCHIITVTPDLLAKLAGVGKDLVQYSLETVQMFYRDATAAGYTINTDRAQGSARRQAG